MFKIIRHGDVSLHPVETSKGKTIEHNGEFVVEWGEVTGHGHRLKVKNPEDLIIQKDTNGDFYFTLKSKGIISHEEHKTLTIQPGTYKKIIEREYDHFNHSIHRVVD